MTLTFQLAKLLDTRAASPESLAANLSDAFSTNRYRRGWTATVKALRRFGLSDLEIEAVIRSKWTRWAADHSNKKDGQVTATDFLRWLVYEGITRARIEELTRDNFSITGREVYNDEEDGKGYDRQYRVQS
jgi:hypothetical protein